MTLRRGGGGFAASIDRPRGESEADGEQPSGNLCSVMDLGGAHRPPCDVGCAPAR